LDKRGGGESRGRKGGGGDKGGFGRKQSLQSVGGLERQSKKFAKGGRSLSRRKKRREAKEVLYTDKGKKTMKRGGRTMVRLNDLRT